MPKFCEKCKKNEKNAKKKKRDFVEKLGNFAKNVRFCDNLRKIAIFFRKTHFFRDLKI